MKMSILLLPFDTETSSMPDWKNPSEGPNQPHIVSLAAALVDSDTREVIEQLDVIVKPDGWEITQETIEIHGITMERAMDEGVPEADVLELFTRMWLKCQLRTAFNTTFDNRIIRIAQKRYFPDSEQHVEWMRSWKEDKKLYYCTMMASKKIMGGKQPTLAEAYEFFMGKKLENAHQASADMMACLDVYFAIQDRQSNASNSEIPAAETA
jgi:DNA polymerase-3 subunit epsilon